MGRLLADEEAALGTPLFTASLDSGGFLAAGPVPSTWEPGMSVELRGPIGRELRIPDKALHVALIAHGVTPTRLLPLAEQALKRPETSVALFSDASLPRLPAALEVQPLQNSPEALTWADFLAIDLPLACLGDLRQALGLGAGEHLPCPGELLIETPMPCGGLADCGACAVPARRGWKLACKDGPVFDINDIEW
jgi:Iron-sulfur cluster binding domain of dihydroorotate dehydrogenase B